MVPALIYLLRVPTNVVIGTSLAYTLITMAVATVLHATANKSVDVMLALILMIGGVIGAQFGAQIGQAMRGEQLRALLALLVLASRCACCSASSCSRTSCSRSAWAGCRHEFRSRAPVLCHRFAGARPRWTGTGRRPCLDAVRR
jgi:hypothetical protein